MEDFRNCSSNICQCNDRVARCKHCYPSCGSAWIVRWWNSNMLMSKLSLVKQRANTDLSRLSLPLYHPVTSPFLRTILLMQTWLVVCPSQLDSLLLPAIPLLHPWISSTMSSLSLVPCHPTFPAQLFLEQTWLAICPSQLGSLLYPAYTLNHLWTCREEPRRSSGAHRSLVPPCSACLMLLCLLLLLCRAAALLCAAAKHPKENLHCDNLLEIATLFLVAATVTCIERWRWKKKGGKEQWEVL